MKRRPRSLSTKRISIAARQAAALDVLLEALGGGDVTAAQMRAIRAEWPKTRRRKNAA